MKTLIYVILH